MEANTMPGQVSVSTEPLSAREGTAPPWHYLKQICFRFAFCYFMLFIMADLIELTRWLDAKHWYVGIWHIIVPAAARHLLHLNVTSLQNQNTDSLYSYVEIFCFALLSLIITIIWSVLDRRRENYDRLYSWFHWLLRMDLGATLIAFGMSKVTPQQFPPLDPIRLSQPLGEMTPCGLLWAVMGYSYPYSAFGGYTEVIAGILLMMPRVSQAGALLAFAVMLNVWMFNMCYGIGLKCYTLHLTAIAALLIAPEWKLLVDLFVLRKPVKPVSLAPLFSAAKLNTLLVVFQILYCMYWTADFYITDCANCARLDESRHAAPLQQGIWLVEDQTIDGKKVGPEHEARLHWSRLIFGKRFMRKGAALVVQDSSGIRTEYPTSLEQPKMIISKDGNSAGELTFAPLSPGRATIDGDCYGKKLHCLLKAMPEKDLKLTGHKFNWISEADPWY